MAVMRLDEKLGQMTQSIWHNGVSPEIVRDVGIGSVIHTEGPFPGETTEEWIAHFNRFQQAALNSRLGIPLLIGVDSVHGQNTFAGAVIFPHNIGMGATRNLTLIEQAARITALESLGTGFNMSFAPCIAMPKHEHWGRVYEGYSEEPEFTREAGLAAIRGLQGVDLARRDTVAATAKHFVADGATSGGVEGGNAIVNEELLRETLLPPYQAAVDAGVAAIMVGFNSVNGINMHQHRQLVTDVLKGEMGFTGMVMTDWDGGLRFGAPHTVINAGIDLAMQPGNHERFISELRASVEDGTVPMARIDDAVRRILELKFKLDLFNDPFAKAEHAPLVGSEAHRAVARQAVRESLVLLKNQNQALPLKAKDSIAVIGPHGNNSGLQSGGWSIHWQGQTESYRGATTIYDAVRAVAPDATYHAEGCPANSPTGTAVVVVGEQPYAEALGDTDELWLSDAHKQMVKDCAQRADRLVVVLISGRVLEISDQFEQSDAFVAAWLPGSEGTGVADFLFGSDGFTPRGRLPLVWPKKAADLPLEIGDERALFPYGYGLQQY
ncbi:MAG: glycosyl hydrolase [Gammaproteobacteria bacterium]|nr:glycosyl hydrolase [Gammaproteobacteria bacterium]